MFRCSICSRSFDTRGKRDAHRRRNCKLPFLSPSTSRRTGLKRPSRRPQEATVPDATTADPPAKRRKVSNGQPNFVRINREVMCTMINALQTFVLDKRSAPQHPLTPNTSGTNTTVDNNEALQHFLQMSEADFICPMYVLLLLATCCYLYVRCSCLDILMEPQSYVPCGHSVCGLCALRWIPAQVSFSILAGFHFVH
jgi:hypothetical protein